MEIITGVERRRQWRDEEKLRILAELDEPGVKFSAVARRHYPPERNQLSAHLTMFHAVPPSAEQELRGRLAALTKVPGSARGRRLAATAG